MEKHLIKEEGWIILVWGAPGAGKSSLARGLSSTLIEMGMRVPYLASDNLNQALIGENFERDLRPIVYGGLLHLTDRLLAERRAVILDGSFLCPQLRGQVEGLAQSHQATLISVLVECSLKTRLVRNSSRPPHQIVPERWVRDAHHRSDYSRKDSHVVIDTETSSIGEGVCRVLDSLSGKLQRKKGLVMKHQSLPGASAGFRINRP